MRILRLLLAIVVVVLLVAAGCLIWTWQPAIAAIAPPAKAAFAPDLVTRGAILARLGDCNSCHTTAGGAAFAGGVALPTPFGTIYGPNITPDPETGIGRWSEAAFRRALRDGVDRRGRYLYPAFPYDHFTKLTDPDIAALYAFLMTRRPVHAGHPANRLRFPLNIRLTVAGWDLLYLRPGAFRPDPAQNAVWNRGAYLVEGVAHCGACHTPRNSLGAEKTAQAFAGGEAEGWYAPALNRASPAPLPWTLDGLVTYLRDGAEAQHGAAAGPMAPVTRNLAAADPQDVRAIATYIAAQEGLAPSEQRQRQAVIAARAAASPAAAPGAAAPPVAALYAGACAQCHSGARPVALGGGIDLAMSTALNAPDPRDAIHIVLEGIRAPEGQPGLMMPGFAGALTDRQIAGLLGELRRRAVGKPGWPALEKQVAEVRQGKAE